MTFTRHFRRLGVSAAVGAALSPLGAQGITLGGTLRDSLAGGPFAGATVHLVPTDSSWSAGLRTRSDSTGRYRFERVPAGSYTLAFTHPRLDTLGMDEVLKRIAVAPGDTALTLDLALPGARSLATAFCGVRTDTTGVVIGRVRDVVTGAARNGARISARWGELVLQGGATQAMSAVVRATADENGRFVLCGVPTDVPVNLQALDGDVAASLPAGAQPASIDTARVDPPARDSSGRIELAFEVGVPLVHRDLWLAAADTTASRAARPVARLRGRVLSPEGTGLAGAQVRVTDGSEDSPSVLTDSTGAFVLDGVPAGTQSVQAIAIGLTPARAVVDVRPGVEGRVVLTLKSRVSTLDAVKVVGFLSRDAREYEERRRRGGMGYFQTGAEVRARGQTLVSYAILRAPGLRVGDVQNGRPVLRGTGNCKPRIFVDGWAVDAEDLDRYVSVQSLGGVEVYRNPFDVPPTLIRGVGATVGTNDPCTTIFVWSKAVVP